eukprot:366212-Chlamydomonas_euryale.AAC.6
MWLRSVIQILHERMDQAAAMRSSTAVVCRCAQPEPCIVAGAQDGVARASLAHKGTRRVTSR